MNADSCLHPVKDWITHTTEDKCLECTIFKPRSLKCIYGDDLSMRFMECNDCKKTIIEILPEGLS